MPGPARVSSARTRSSAAGVVTAFPSGHSGAVPAPGAAVAALGAVIVAPGGVVAGSAAGAVAVAVAVAVTAAAPVSAAILLTWMAKSKLPSGTTAQPEFGRSTARPSPM